MASPRLRPAAAAALVAAVCHAVMASAAGLAVEPTLQEVVAAAGQQAPATITLGNPGDSPIRVRLSLADIGADGRILAPERESPRSLAPVLSLPTSPMDIAPGQRLSVSLTVRADGTARVGYVVADAFSPPSASAPFARVPLLLVVSPHVPVPAPSLSLAARRTGDISLVLHNPGPRLIHATGSVFLLSPGGTFIGKLAVPETYVIPGHDVTVSLRWPAALPSGTVVQAALKIAGRDDPSTASSTVP